MSTFILALFFLAFPVFAESLPQRVVSTSLASDEILFDLMTLCHRSNHLIALSTMADDPKYSNISKSASRIKNRVAANRESILRQNPDLVVLANYQKIELNKKTIFLDDFSSFASIKNNIKKLGDAVGCVKESEKMISDFDQILLSVQKTINKLRVLSFSAPGVTMAKNTTFDDVIRHTGAVNLASEQGLVNWPKISVEFVLKHEPDIIVIFDDDDLKSLKNLPGWKSLKAVKSEHIVKLHGASAMALSHYVSKSVLELSENLKKFDRGEAGQKPAK